jgi:hypothetical protein
MGLLFGYLTGGNAFLYAAQQVISGTLSEYILAAVPFHFMGAAMGSSGWPSGL